MKDNQMIAFLQIQEYELTVKEITSQQYKIHDRLIDVKFAWKPKWIKEKNQRFKFTKTLNAKSRK